MKKYLCIVLAVFLLPLTNTAKADSSDNKFLYDGNNYSSVNSDKTSGTVKIKEKVGKLKDYLSYGNSYPDLNSFFKKMLTPYYSYELNQSSEIKNRFNNYLNWLIANPDLFEKFESAIEKGYINIDENYNTGDEDIFAIFSCWLGTIYAENQFKELTGFRQNKLVYLYSPVKKSYSGPGKVKDNDIMFNRMDSFESYEEIFISSFAIGIHERTHLFGNNKLLSEMISLWFTDMLALPVGIDNQTDYPKLSNGINIICGRRNFYDIYTKINKSVSTTFKDELENYIMVEYTEGAFYPWLKNNITKNNFKYFLIPSLDYRQFSEIFDDIKDNKNVSAEYIYDILISRLEIIDTETKDKIKNVIWKLCAEYKGKYNADCIEFTGRFVELMNEYFGEPDIEQWEKFADENFLLSQKRV
jgi:hypothetical protein